MMMIMMMMLFLLLAGQERVDWGIELVPEMCSEDEYCNSDIPATTTDLVVEDTTSDPAES